jgi:uncharacterized protein
MWTLGLRRRRRIRAAAPRVAFSKVRAMSPERLACLLSANPSEAIGWVGAAARYGLVEAQLLFGQMLLDGIGTPRNQWAAFRWFSAVAEAGWADAINMVGRCHEGGWGVEQDFPKAVQYYRKAAELGLDWGQYNLANTLLRGRGVPRDRRQALTWYLRAARLGHAKSMNLVGRFFEGGWDVPADRQTAHHWYRRSAEGGDFRGQYAPNQRFARSALTPWRVSKRTNLADVRQDRQGQVDPFQHRRGKTGDRPSPRRPPPTYTSGELTQRRQIRSGRALLLVEPR